MPLQKISERSLDTETEMPFDCEIEILLDTETKMSLATRDAA